MKNNELRLCGPPGFCPPCCPNLIYKKDHFIIEDDYDDIIKINNKDMEKLINDVDKILSLHRSSLDNKG